MEQDGMVDLVLKVEKIIDPDLENCKEDRIVGYLENKGIPKDVISIDIKMEVYYMNEKKDSR